MIEIMVSVLRIQPFRTWRSFPYSLVIRHRRFGGAHCLRLQYKISKLKKEISDSSEMLAHIYQTARHHPLRP
jgi:hypothetical protein